MQMEEQNRLFKETEEKDAENARKKMETEQIKLITAVSKRSALEDARKDTLEKVKRKEHRKKKRKRKPN